MLVGCSQPGHLAPERTPVVKAAANVALDEPVDAFPDAVDFGKCRVTPPSWSESMTVNREAWFVKRLKHWSE